MCVESVWSCFYAFVVVFIFVVVVLSCVAIGTRRIVSGGEQDNSGDIVRMAVREGVSLPPAPK